MMARKSFNYDLVKDGAARRKAQAHAKDIRVLLERTAEAVVSIGHKLREVRDSMTPAMFRAWLEAEFKWTWSVAINYMQAAKVFGDVDCLKQFQPSAVVSLSRKNVPETAIRQALAQARKGEVVTYRVAKKLLDDHGYKPIRKDAGTGVTCNVHGDKLLSAADVGALQRSLDTLSAELNGLLARLSHDDREALADRFFRLAMELKGPSQMAATNKRTKRRELEAAVN